MDLPVYDSDDFGRVGAAICFDLDHPTFIQQASSKGVDLLLQPSETWFV
jgi:predicted amidohydrolase